MSEHTFILIGVFHPAKLSILTGKCFSTVPKKGFAHYRQKISIKLSEMRPKSWFRKGGYDVPLFIPHTPGEELVKRIRAKEAENNQGRRIRYKVQDCWEEGSDSRRKARKIKSMGW